MAVNVWSKLGFDDMGMWQLIVGVKYFWRKGNGIVNGWSKLGFDNRGMWQLIIGVKYFWK
jgi:hypothetical protein